MDELAKSILKKNFLLIEDDKTCEAHTHLVIEAMIEYAKIKCKEQRNICATQILPPHANDKCKTMLSIVALNAPEPNFE